MVNSTVRHTHTVRFSIHSTIVLIRSWTTVGTQFQKGIQKDFKLRGVIRFRPSDPFVNKYDWINSGKTSQQAFTSKLLISMIATNLLGPSVNMFVIPLSFGFLYCRISFSQYSRVRVIPGRHRDSKYKASSHLKSSL